MAIRSDAQRKAVAKYNTANYEQIQIRVPKGEKDIIKAAADRAGESLNAYIYSAICKQMEADGLGDRNGNAMEPDSTRGAVMEFDAPACDGIL